MRVVTRSLFVAACLSAYAPVAYSQPNPRSDAAPAAERWQDISPRTVNRDQPPLPPSGSAAGPSVASLQILLDRVQFSPGILDGYWGKNTEKAVYWLQKREGMSANGQVDGNTFDRLFQLAGSPEQLIRAYQLSPEDVAGPFVDVPEEVYAKAEMDCLCYRSRSEKLAELFHSTPELLRQLNPGVDLERASAGTTLQVPNIEVELGLNRLNDLAPERKNIPAGQLFPGPDTSKIAQIVISDGGHYLHALDASGRILYHFPSTLGSQFAPSPSGKFQISSVTYDPVWYYQPELLTGVPDSKPNAHIPPGPNNAVGVVWMDLSEPHYGIHGTSAPQTIGYATSHGCVRLTNWDALFLAKRVAKGTPVHFTTTAGASGAP